MSGTTILHCCSDLDESSLQTWSPPVDLFEMDDNGLVDAVARMEAIEPEANDEYIVALAGSNFHFPHPLLTVTYNNIHSVEVLPRYRDSYRLDVAFASTPDEIEYRKSRGPPEGNQTTLPNSLIVVAHQLDFCLLACDQLPLAEIPSLRPAASLFRLMMNASLWGYDEDQWIAARDWFNSTLRADFLPPRMQTNGRLDLERCYFAIAPGIRQIAFTTSLYARCAHCDNKTRSPTATRRYRLWYPWQNGPYTSLQSAFDNCFEEFDPVDTEGTVTCHVDSCPGRLVKKHVVDDRPPYRLCLGSDWPSELLKKRVSSVNLRVWYSTVTSRIVEYHSTVRIAERTKGRFAVLRDHRDSMEAQGLNDHYRQFKPCHTWEEENLLKNTVLWFFTYHHKRAA